MVFLLKLRRVTIRGAYPSARLSEAICLSSLCEGLLERSAEVCADLQGSMGFSEVLDPVLVTLRNCWTSVLCLQNHPKQGLFKELRMKCVIVAKLLL